MGSSIKIGARHTTAVQEPRQVGTDGPLEGVEKPLVCFSSTTLRHAKIGGLLVMARVNADHA
jgi:hypothetical protein